MAESDPRLETLEDEVKVLKGEVKRTLVDLRALLMREDSPLGENGFSRRSAAADRGSNSGRTEGEVTELANLTAAKPIPAPPPPPAPEPVLVAAAAPLPEAASPGPVPAQVEQPQPVTAAPQTDSGPGPGPALDVFPPGSSQLAAPLVQGDPGPGSGQFPMAPPAPAVTPPPPAGPGPAPDLAGLAEQERRMADQERRIAEQERRMFERERQLTETSRQPEPPHRQESDDRYLEEAEEEQPVPKAERRNGRSHRRNVWMPNPPETSEEEYREQVASQALHRILDDVTLPRQRSRRLRQDQPGGGHHTPVHHEDSSLNLDLLEMKQLGEDDFESAEQNGRRVSVYDEYWELLKDRKEANPVEDSPTGPPMDVNLLSSLVHWASLAKQRVGEQQLKDILEVYIQSGNSRPELQELLLHLSDMVEEAAAEGGDSAEEWVDLMFHLHGILTGGLSVAKIPQMKFSGQSAPERDGSS